MEQNKKKAYTEICMVSKNEINAALDKMILSASGWRGIFSADGGEEGTADQISGPHRIIASSAALVFAQYLGGSVGSANPPLVLVGSDTRPTGKAIAGAMIPVLLACGCKVRYAGFTAAPEIMAWARSAGEAYNGKAGFIYISASHNPIGHNGLKFGLTDGGVLAGEETAKLIVSFRGFLERDDCTAKIESLINAADPALLQKVYDGEADAKAESRKAYYDFCGNVVWGGNSALAKVLKDGLEKRPLGAVCDFNGSARTVSIDRDFFSSLGLKFDCINSGPGQIVHRIVPEGESLQPCSELLESAHARDASFMLGYVPDCDGDRGNLVIWDAQKQHGEAVWMNNLTRRSPNEIFSNSESGFALANPAGDTMKKARALEAQEVFALAIVAELSHLVWTGELSYDGNGKALNKTAVAVNDPTSMRVERIAGAFGVSVFHAEVGEANVVGLARKLREEGFIVRILGEGSAGGNITHPSAVRDPINTVLAIVKLLSVRSTEGRPGLFEHWCRLSGYAYREDFSLSDIIASLPPFESTPAYSPDAVLRIKTKDHSLLKDRYQQIFLREWEGRKDEFKTRCGFCSWQAIAYNGLAEKRDISRFGEAGKGGLKINFLDGEGRAAAYIWMRGSATEPVFRIMADVECLPERKSAWERLERDLLLWQRRMIMEADGLES
jgi:phosphoglucomutase